MGTQLGDAAGDEYGDLVGVARGRDAVGNKDGRATAHDLAQAGEDALFGIGVHARQRIVEDQDARVADDGAGDGGALLLPAGEGDAAFADQSLKAAGNSRISAAMCAMVAASSISGAVASGRPKAMLCAMVSEKRKVSCGTKPMAARSCAKG